MQNVSCPSCGAPVGFRSHASVMAVCEFCRATVVKDAGAVQDLGKMSEVLEDYSRVQVGTAGVLAGRSFTVIGRIQLRYDAGMWNEWYLLFDDGTDGWLGDTSGQYVLTTKRELAPGWPAFEAIKVTRQYDIGFGPYVASDKRVARCSGGQGELPFRVGEGWEARVADFRRGPSFATLDYSDGDTPLLYAGTAVTLEGLKCQLLRDDEQIKASAGRYRGKVDLLQCPSCGSSIRYLPGLATQCVCPSCATPLDASSPRTEVLRKGEQHERVPFTLSLGANAKIGAVDYRVLGLMRRESNEGDTWSEYLLYSTQGPFFWLVETDEGWSRSDVMDDWPTPPLPAMGRVQVDNVDYERTWVYQARVVYAAGAFNWRVAAGDMVHVAEYEHGQGGLAAEHTAEELTWSRSTPVALDQVRAWFKLPAPAKAMKGAEGASTGRDIAWKTLLWIFGLNFIPLVFNFGATLAWILVGTVALFLPLLLAPEK
ncbi:DUF4178 domain-containing protein [Telluria aromaticivorans]|uniref:DUF4178 domain-containing protein n=1 Tax=Telluria aromaticivorans TaxID=2725995 RepID=A0A7Y2K0M6_9BURK|nr:DUF4178 domain-containing protein [Telluria aromaticivorans]NNG24440.1 DUF4178 domain-containing protein [Telluria aromaticivorans]